MTRPVAGMLFGVRCSDRRLDRFPAWELGLSRMGKTPIWLRNGEVVLYLGGDDKHLLRFLSTRGVIWIDVTYVKRLVDDVWLEKM